MFNFTQPQEQLPYSWIYTNTTTLQILPNFYSQPTTELEESNKRKLETNEFENSKKFKLDDDNEFLSIPIDEYYEPLNQIDSEEDEKIFSFYCEFCNKGFHDNSNLKRHLRTHTNEKPYECKQCDKKFGHSQSLKDHILTVHKNQKPYPCKFCNKSYGNASNLRRHVKKAHQEEK